MSRSKQSDVCGPLRLVLLGISLAGAILAQQGKGTISGTVTDAQTAVIPAVKIEIRNVGTNAVFRTSSNETGYYTAPGLAVGEYEVTAQLEGFKRAVRGGITLQVDQTARVDFVLQVGQVTETVEVVAEAPLVDANSATVGKVVENRRIQELPLNGRNAMALVMLTPGVRSPVGPTNSGFADRGINLSAVSINNSPRSMNGQLMDGSNNVLGWVGDVSVPPAVDAVEEFKVQSGSMAAEFGFTAGGVVNLVTKSGTNAFHGTAYEFLRNDKFDARNTFATGKNHLRYNQFGGSIGGPVVKNKTFFFFNLEDYRLRRGSTSISTMPVAAEREGDFSNTRDVKGNLIPIYDPLTTRANPSGSGYVRDLFAGNKIPASRLDPVSVNVLELYPLPNRTPSDPYTNSRNYQRQIVQPTDSNQYHTRGDHRFGDRNTLFGRVSWFTHKTQQTSVYPGPMHGRADDTGNKHIVLSDTHMFSPTLLNEFRVGISRQSFTFVDNSYGQNWPQKLGLPTDFPPDVLPLVAISGFSKLGNGSVGNRASLVWSFQEAVTRIQGNHTMKFGVEHRLLRGNNRQSSYPSGSFTFDAVLTRNPQKTAGTGYGLASMVLGEVRSATADQVLGQSEQAYSTSFFVQDDWKVARRLTINLGLRYDFQQQAVERYDRWSNFDMNGTSSVSGLRGRAVYAGVDGQPRTWRDEDYNDIGPRIGFAWDLLGKGKTVLRGGYGLYYPYMFNDHDKGGSAAGFTSRTTSYIPVGSDYNIAAFQFKDGFPYAPLQLLGRAGGDDAFLGQSATFVESSGRTPQAHQWSLALQQELPGHWLVDVTYSGNKGTHFSAGSYGYNQLDPQYLSLGLALQDKVPNPYAGIVSGSLGAATITRQQSLLPFPYYSSVSVTAPRLGSYISHLLLLSVEKKMTRGLTLMFSYTGGKLISDNTYVPVDWVGENSGDTVGYQNGKYNRRAERSVDPQDVSQRAVISAVYELPFGRGKTWDVSSATLNKLIGGWQVNTIGTIQAGLPLTVRGANNYLANRPNSTGTSAKLDNPNRDHWFDTSQFVNPPSYTYGNVSRTLPDVRSAGTVNWDLSLIKNTGLTERTKLQFRAEAFNFLNHVNLGYPNDSFVAGADGKNASGTFGVVGSARDARIIQFALKLVF